PANAGWPFRLGPCSDNAVARCKHRAREKRRRGPSDNPADLTGLAGLTGLGSLTGHFFVPVAGCCPVRTHKHKKLHPPHRGCGSERRPATGRGVRNARFNGGLMILLTDNGGVESTCLPPAIKFR